MWWLGALQQQCTGWSALSARRLAHGRSSAEAQAAAQVLKHWISSYPFREPGNPVQTASWAPSALAVAVVINNASPPWSPCQILVFSSALNLLWNQPSADHVAWAPCSAVLAYLSRGKLGAIELPGRATSGASRAHLELIADLQAETAGLSVRHVIWSLGGTCVCKVVSDEQEQNLLVWHANDTQGTLPFEQLSWAIVGCTATRPYLSAPAAGAFSLQPQRL